MRRRDVEGRRGTKFTDSADSAARVLRAARDGVGLALRQRHDWRAARGEGLISKVECLGRRAVGLSRKQGGPE
jgi:hypothetical protein